MDGPGEHERDGVGWIDLASCGTLVLVIIAGGIAASPRRRPPGNESAAIGALKTINTSQTLFREGDKELDGTLDYGNLQELSNTTLIDAVLGSGVKQGYLFEVRPSPTTPEFLWFAVANPALPGTTGDRYFCTNHMGIIYYTGSAGGPIALFDGGPECTIPARLLPVRK
jgi:hypothetical protein